MDKGTAWARTVTCPDPAHGLGSRAAPGSKSLTRSISPRWPGRKSTRRPCPEGLVVSGGTLRSPRRRYGTEAIGRLIRAVCSARSGRRVNFRSPRPARAKKGQRSRWSTSSPSPRAARAERGLARVLRYQPPPDECSSRASSGATSRGRNAPEGSSRTAARYQRLRRTATRYPT